MTMRRVAFGSLVTAALSLAACSSSNKTITIGSNDVGSNTTVTSAPKESGAPTTTKAGGKPSSPSTTKPAAFDLYDEVDPPDRPTGHTHAFKSSGVLADGVYWVFYNGGKQQTPDVTVFQAFFGDECEKEATKADDECLNDMFIGEGERDIDNLPFAKDVFISVSSSDEPRSYFITPKELVKIYSSSPSNGAPDDFSFTPFGFLMTVKKGEITRFEQAWTP